MTSLRFTELNEKSKNFLHHGMWILVSVLSIMMVRESGMRVWDYVALNHQLVNVAWGEKCYIGERPMWLPCHHTTESVMSRHITCPSCL